MNNRRRKDLVLTEKVTPDLARINAFDLHVGDGAHLLGIKRGVEANLRNVFETIHPIARKITQARFFALAADAVVKEYRFADGQLRRGGMRADLFELANVRLLLFFGSEQRPDLGDFVALHIKQSRSLRRIEPFVQAGAEVVAVQVRLFEIELRK